VGTALLNPVELRRTVEQADLFVIRALAALVEARTMLINFARGITKTMGHRLPSSTSHCFAERVRAAVPEALHPALLRLLLPRVGGRFALFSNVARSVGQVCQAGRLH
jgi:transposase